MNDQMVMHMYITLVLITSSVQFEPVLTKKSKDVPRMFRTQVSQLFRFMTSGEDLVRQIKTSFDLPYCIRNL